MPLLLPALLLSIAAAHVASGAPDPVPDVHITGLPEHYSAREPVTFTVKNDSANALRIACGIEKLLQERDQKWAELGNRLEDGRPVKERIFYTLPPGAVRTLTWNPRLIRLPPGRTREWLAGTYRVIVEAHVSTVEPIRGVEAGSVALTSHPFTYR